MIGCSDEWVFSGNNCWAVDHSVSLNDSYDPIFSHLLWMEKGEPDNSDGACAPTVNTAAAAQQRCNDCNYGRERRNESHTSAGVGFFSETTAEAFTALFLRRSATDSHDSTGSRERRPLSSHVRTDQFLRAAPVSGSTLAGGMRPSAIVSLQLIKISNAGLSRRLQQNGGAEQGFYGVQDSLECQKAETSRLGKC